MARVAICPVPAGGPKLKYEPLVRNDNRSAKPIRLKRAVSPGDDPAPAVTIMLPGED